MILIATNIIFAALFVMYLIKYLREKKKNTKTERLLKKHNVYYKENILTEKQKFKN